MARQGGEALLDALCARLPCRAAAERAVLRLVLIARGGAKAAWVRAEFEIFADALEIQQEELARVLAALEAEPTPDAVEFMISSAKFSVIIS